MAKIAKAVTGLLALLWCAQLHATVVLQYHHVSDTTPPSTSVTPELFEQHLDYLAAEGFHVASLPEIVAKLKKDEALPDKTVVLTFDDAYSSVYDIAFPLMKARNWPFTVFVNTNPIDNQRKGFATWDQLREMAEQGGTIANHSTAHGFLPRRASGESEAQWRQRITKEIMTAEQRIKEETGQSHKVLAYPYGEFDKRVQALLRELGFIAFAQNSGPLAPHNDLLALPRFPFGGVFGAPDDFALKASTRPMPATAIARCTDRDCEQPLDDVVVAQGQRPVLAITVKNKSLLPAINCFASRQGAIETWVDGNTLYTRANEPLSPGRTQYNCTAPSGERGRFFWLSQQWLVTDKDGNWRHDS